MAQKRRKYRLAMLDDLTLREVFHFRVSLLGVISVFTLTFVLIIALLSVLIIFTPIRNVLPGYSESLRQQLIQESARVDSLQTSLTLQRQYLDVIKQLTAGDIQSDSVQSLDSLERVERAQILELRNEATDAFMAQYEQKERDRLLLFDNTQNRQVQQLIRPVHGVVAQHANMEHHQYAMTISVAKTENVLSVLRGTVIYIEQALDNTYTVLIDHTQYTSIYRGLRTSMKTVGAHVEAGEAIGQVTSQHDMGFELWHEDRSVNPEEVIAW